MKQITIFSGNERDETYKNYAKEFPKNNKDRLKISCKDFVSKYLKKELPNFRNKSIIIDQIPNWELIKIYRIILNLEHNVFTLFIDYKEEDVVNRYS